MQRCKKVAAASECYTAQDFWLYSTQAAFRILHTSKISTACLQVHAWRCHNFSHHLVSRRQKGSRMRFGRCSKEIHVRVWDQPVSMLRRCCPGEQDTCPGLIWPIARNGQRPRPRRVFPQPESRSCLLPAQSSHTEWPMSSSNKCRDLMTVSEGRSTVTTTVKPAANKQALRLLCQGYTKSNCGSHTPRDGLCPWAWCRLVRNPAFVGECTRCCCSSRGQVICPVTSGTTTAFCGYTGAIAQRQVLWRQVVAQPSGHTQGKICSTSRTAGVLNLTNAVL